MHKCIRKHQQLEIQEAEGEEARYAAGGGVNQDGTKMSRRPDLQASSRMMSEGHIVNTHTFSGHTPGIPIGKM